MSDLSLIWLQFLSFWNFELLKLSKDHTTVGSVIIATGLVAFAVYLLPIIKRWFMRKVLLKTGLETRTKVEALWIFRILLFIGGAFAILKILGLAPFVTEQLTILQKQLAAVFDLRLFTLGKTSLTLWSTIYLVVLSWLLVRISGQVETVFLDRIQNHTKIDRGICQTLSTVLRYALVFIGMIVIIQSAGIDLSALTIIAGATGIALGLGLQNIINNLVSGLVILFERPIKLGDRVDVGGTVGDVAHLSMRSTTIVTNDDIAIIVPNSDFITSKVVNWTYTGKKCRFNFPVRVAYGSSPDLVRTLLLEAAAEHEGVLEKPPPSVNFDEFGDSSLNFSLSVWTIDYLTKSTRLRSDLNFAISRKFAEHGVQLPTPVDDTQFPMVSDLSAESFHPGASASKSSPTPNLGS